MINDIIPLTINIINNSKIFIDILIIIIDNTSIIINRVSVTILIEDIVLIIIY